MNPKTAEWTFAIFGLVAIAVLTEVNGPLGAFLLVLIVLGMLYTAERKGYFAAT
jgi:hypothetical protein